VWGGIPCGGKHIIIDRDRYKIGRRKEEQGRAAERAGGGGAGVRLKEE